MRDQSGILWPTAPATPTGAGTKIDCPLVEAAKGVATSLKKAVTR